jgi:hypothetical protein
VKVPHWVSSALFAGSFLLLLWGCYVLTFTSEPSAVGRVLVALVVIGGASIGGAILGFVASIGLFLRTRWAATTAWLASVVLLFSIVSSWAGVIGLAGLISSRVSSRT